MKQHFAAYLSLFVSGWWAVCHRKPLISVQEPLAGDSFAQSPHLLEWKRLITVSSLWLSWVSVWRSRLKRSLWSERERTETQSWCEGNPEQERDAPVSPDLRQLQTRLFYITERICYNEWDSNFMLKVGSPKNECLPNTFGILSSVKHKIRKSK